MAPKSPTKPRRVRRKCSHPSCPNRVVQGGVCVTHGAKRKLCLHPGCVKAVKLAGYCSTHGPARKKCDAVGCTRVAVQGGKCLSHGAKRRVCKFPKERCEKNAIVGGMCKKHYDMMKDANGLLDTFTGGQCVQIEGSASAESEGTEGSEVNGVYARGEAHAYDEENVKPPAAPMMADPQGVPHQPYYQMPPAETPFLNGQPHHQAEAPMPPTDYYKPPLKKKNKHPRHQRGLSIFEDMGTVDAIINSGNQNGVVLPSAAAPSPPGYGYPTPDAAVMPPPPPPKSLPQVPIMSTRTPNPQVSFADTATTAHPARSATKPAEEDYYSPTIAIFEQMIKASEVLDNPYAAQGYAGLSPPKLTPRGRRHVSFHDRRHHEASAAADLQRTVSHDEEVHHHPAAHPTAGQPRRVTSPTNEMLQPSSYAPETPDLEASEPMNIVSAGSHHGHHEGGQVLLPKRDGYEHLFIPRALG